MRTRTVTPASRWEPPTSNPTLRTVVGSMAAPLRLAVAFVNMCLTIHYDQFKHPACGSLVLKVTDRCAPSDHKAMESTLYNVDLKLYDVLRTLITTRQLQHFSPDALHANVAYSPTVEYIPIRGPLNEQAVALDPNAPRHITPPPSQVTSATIGSHLVTKYCHHGYTAYTFDNVAQITPRDWVSVYELISNYQKLCRFNVYHLEHYTAAQLSKDIVTRPPERLCVRVTVLPSQVFAANAPTTPVGLHSRSQLIGSGTT
eukprot:4280797-Prymnesium_polylepis.2